jgi:hypothetical protein
VSDPEDQGRRRKDRGPESGAQRLPSHDDYGEGWLKRKLLELHRGMLDEPVPGELLDIVERISQMGEPNRMEDRVALDRWWPFSKAMVDYERNEPGVYQFATASGAIVYIGSSNEIRDRLKEHIGEDVKSCVRQNATQYRVEYRPDYLEEEQRLYNEFVRQNGRAPQCNEVRA